MVVLTTQVVRPPADPPAGSSVAVATPTTASASLAVAVPTATRSHSPVTDALGPSSGSSSSGCSCSVSSSGLSPSPAGSRAASARKRALPTSPPPAAAVGERPATREEGKGGVQFELGSESGVDVHDGGPGSHEEGAPAVVHSEAQIGDYRLLKTLGEGAFAKVRAAIHLPTGHEVAIKIIDKAKIKEPYVLKHLQREGNLMRDLDHPHIVRLFEIIETPHIYCLVTEKANGGEILDYIVAHGTVAEKEARKYVRQLATAISYLHSRGVVHRDLKAENVLLDGSLDVKVIDFGLGNFFEASAKLHTQCGSPAYTAPELLGGKSYGKEVDIWSIGINMYAMLTGRLPFSSNNVTKLHALILDQRFHMPRELSGACQDLLRRLLTVKPRDRITVEELLAHPWLRSHGNAPPAATTAPTTTTTAPISVLNPAVLAHVAAALGTTRDAVADSVSRHRADAAAAHYALALLSGGPAAWATRPPLSPSPPRRTTSLSNMAPGRSRSRSVGKALPLTAPAEGLPTGRPPVRRHSSRRRPPRKLTAPETSSSPAASLAASPPAAGPSAPRPPSCPRSRRTGSFRRRSSAGSIGTTSTTSTASASTSPPPDLDAPTPRRRSSSSRDGSNSSLEPPRLRRSSSFEANLKAGTLDQREQQPARRCASAKDRSPDLPAASDGGPGARPRSGTTATSALPHIAGRTKAPAASAPQPRLSRRNSLPSRLRSARRRLPAPIDPATPSGASAARSRLQQPHKQPRHQHHPPPPPPSAAPAPALRSMRYPLDKRMVSRKPALETYAALLAALDGCGVGTVCDEAAHSACCELGDVVFNAEVVKLQRLEGVHGLYFHRVRGDALAYTDVCTRLLDAMALGEA